MPIKPTNPTADLDAARAAMDREKRRRDEAEVALQKLEADVDATDPDAREFAAVAAKRDTARARLAVLGGRVERAATGLEVAEASVAAAERHAKATELAKLSREIEEADAAITREVLAFRVRLVELATAQRERCSRADELDGWAVGRSYWARAAGAPASVFHLIPGHPAVHLLLARIRVGAA